MIGHESQWQLLTDLLKNRSLPHALLFSGQSGLGKKEMALRLAKLEYCHSSHGEPCFLCQSCKNIDRGILPWVKVVIPEKGEIHIKQIKEMSSALGFSAGDQFQFSIIDQAHLMNDHAQSALLKFLEEPPAMTIIILVSEKPEIMLSTVISRVQKVRFYPVAEPKIQEYLLSLRADKNTARLAAQLSLGSPGRALEIFRNPNALASYKKNWEDFIEIKKAGHVRRFQYAKKLTESKEESRREICNILDSWILQGRLEMLEVCRQGSFPDIADDISRIEETNNVIKNTNCSPRLALENLLLNL